MIEKTEFLANKINEFIEKYGEVPPYWISTRLTSK